MNPTSTRIALFFLEAIDGILDKIAEGVERSLSAV